MSSAEDNDNVLMHSVKCDSCGRHLGWSDDQRVLSVILCNRCMDHPEEVAARLGEVS
jgi:hypothetical protein